MDRVDLQLKQTFFNPLTRRWEEEVVGRFSYDGQSISYEGDPRYDLRNLVIYVWDETESKSKSVSSDNDPYLWINNVSDSLQYSAYMERV